MIFKLSFSVFLLIMATTNAYPLTTIVTINTTTTEETKPLLPMRDIISNSSYPWMKVDEKIYYLGTVIKLDWFRALQFCTFNNMRLVSILTKTESDNIAQLLNESAIGYDRFWTSGSDYGEDKNFFWMSNGKKIIYSNWHPKEPNKNKPTEQCIELLDKGDGKGFMWNLFDCGVAKNFLCESN